MLHMYILRYAIVWVMLSGSWVIAAELWIISRKVPVQLHQPFKYLNISTTRHILNCMHILNCIKQWSIRAAPCTKQASVLWPSPKPTHQILTLITFGYHSYLLSSDPTQTVLFFLPADDAVCMMVTLAILKILLTPGTVKTWTLLTLLTPVSTVNSMATICANFELLVASHKMLSPMYAAQSICSEWHMLIHNSIVFTKISTQNLGIYNYRHLEIPIPYSGKVWWWESLANLVDRPWFAKLKPSNLVLTIDNLLADLLICQTFFRQMLEKSQFAKLSRYTVYWIV